MPPLALLVGWRVAIALSASVVGLCAGLTWLLYRDPPEPPTASSLPRQPSSLSVLMDRDLWLVAITTMVFAGMQTVWMSFLVLYLRQVVDIPLVAAARYLVLAQVMGMLGRVVFGLLSDRTFGGRRRIVLALAGTGSTLCSFVIAGTGQGTGPLLLLPLAACFGFFGIGWNGVQHTLLAELAGPRSAGTALGFGLAISSVGVTVFPPLFGLAVDWSGGFAPAWTAIGIVMVAALVLLLPVREGKMDGL